MIYFAVYILIGLLMAITTLPKIWELGLSGATFNEKVADVFIITVSWPVPVVIFLLKSFRGN